MNPMIQKWIGSIIRSLLAGVVPFLLSVGMSEADTNQLVTLIAGFLAATAWSMWEKFTTRKKMLTAAAMPRQTSEAEVKAVIADGQAPSVSTPKNVVPELSASAS